MKSYWPFDPNKSDKSCRLYLLSGLEDLLLNESLQQLTQTAQKAGFANHHRLHGAEDLDQGKMETLIINPGLFAEGTLIDLRLPEGKTGRTGAKVLSAIINKIAQQSHVFFIITANNTKTKLSAKWVETIEKIGTHIQHPLLNDVRKQQWLGHRLQQANLSIDPKGQNFLLRLTEGNLLALEQQIKQLELSELRQIDYEALYLRFQDEARFNLYDLPVKVLTGQSVRALRMCRRLRQEGEPLVRILWSLINELTLAIALAELQQQKQSPNTFFRKNRIWKDRETLLYQIANQGLETLTQRANTLHLIDKQSKGQTWGDGWLSLETFISDCAFKNN